ncbi:MAG: hypothetical protein FWC40_02570 [Proteobacteria bacterium]|nr:hypothetical protein [Pseudomonadota bacterium]
MRVPEVFSAPGVVPADAVMEQLEPVPRALRPVHWACAAAWRVIVFLLFMLPTLPAMVFLFRWYSETALLLYWFVLVALASLTFIFLPWHLISSYSRKRASFSRCRRLYENGVSTRGQVNMLMRVTGHDHENVYLTQHCTLLSLFSLVRVRIDYTFVVEGAVKTGSLYIPEKFARNLGIDEDICVLYNAEDVAESMIFPLPTEAFPLTTAHC